MKFVQRNFSAKENLNMSEQLANLSIFCNFFQRCNIFLFVLSAENSVLFPEALNLFFKSSNLFYMKGF